MCANYWEVFNLLDVVDGLEYLHAHFFVNTEFERAIGKVLVLFEDFFWVVRGRVC